jgi:ABC-2 type transport system permease protein
MANRIIRLIIKEFLVVLRDRRSRIILVLPPLVQLLIFSFAATHEVRNVTLGIYAEDNGSAARELIDRFEAVPVTFSHIKYYNDLKEVKQAIDAQDILAAVHIGPTFSKNIEAGEHTSIQILLDGREANAALVVQGYINRIVQDFVSEWTSYREMHKTGGRHIRSTLVSRIWFNPNLNSTWSTVPALVGILSNLVVLMITALSVARERELGTFEQLLVSPLRPVEILIGKTMPALILGFVEGIFMMSMAVLIFRLPITLRGVLLLLGVMFLFLLSIVGVGLFISSLAKTQQQGFLGAFTYQVPATLLCGFATPIENIPDWLRWVAYVNPLQYMVTICRTIFLENPSITLVVSMVWPLIPIGLTTLTQPYYSERKWNSYDVVKAKKL